MKFLRDITASIMNTEKKDSAFSYILNHCSLMLCSLDMAQDSNELRHYHTSFNHFIETLSEHELEVCRKTILTVSEALKVAQCLDTTPASFSMDLDQALNQLEKPESMKTLHSEAEKKELMENIVCPNSLYSAMGSLIYQATHKLTDKEKQEHAIIQQTRLNVALNHEWEDQNSVNYWYALHYFLKEDKDNTRFFIRKCLENASLRDLEMIAEPSHKVWIKKQLPSEFHEINLHEYKAFLERQNISISSMPLNHKKI